MQTILGRAILESSKGPLFLDLRFWSINAANNFTYEAEMSAQLE